MKRPRSMAARLILTLTGIMMLFWLLATAFAVMVMHEEFDEVFNSVLQETADRLAPLVAHELLQRPNETVERRLLHAGGPEEGEEYLTYQVRDGSGRLLMRSHDAPTEPFAAPLVPGFRDTRDRRVYTIAVGETAFLQVADPLSHRREAEIESAVFLTIPLVALIPVIIFAIWAIVRRALAPVGALRQAIGARGGGDLSALPRQRLPRELEAIAGSVDRLLERLRAALEAERAFAANSAHELRTPVAGAIAQTQQLVAELSDGRARERARRIEKSLSGLAKLTTKLLELSRAEAGIGRAERPADLVPVVEMLVNDMQRESEGRSAIRFDIPDGTSLMRAVDLDAFAIALRNLIENALRHGALDSPVVVSVRPGGIVSVINGGPVVPPAVLSTLSARFRRGGTSVKGAGLGLAIAEGLAGQMGGRLELLSPACGREDGFEARIVLGDDTA